MSKDGPRQHWTKGGLWALRKRGLSGGETLWSDSGGDKKRGSERACDSVCVYVCEGRRRERGKERERKAREKEKLTIACEQKLLVGRKVRALLLRKAGAPWKRRVRLG